MLQKNITVFLIPSHLYLHFLCCVVIARLLLWWCLPPQGNLILEYKNIQTCRSHSLTIVQAEQERETGSSGEKSSEITDSRLQSGCVWCIMLLTLLSDPAGVPLRIRCVQHDVLLASLFRTSLFLSVLLFLYLSLCISPSSSSPRRAFLPLSCFLVLFSSFPYLSACFLSLYFLISPFVSFLPSSSFVFISVFLFPSLHFWPLHLSHPVTDDS